MTTVAARAVSCPEPDILTPKAMASKEAEYTVIVDNTASRENVTRFAEHQGYTVTITEHNGEYTLAIKK